MLSLLINKKIIKELWKFFDNLVSMLGIINWLNNNTLYDSKQININKIIFYISVTSRLRRDLPICPIIRIL
jgi:hypothetical protein